MGGLGVVTHAGPALGSVLQGGSHDAFLSSVLVVRYDAVEGPSLRTVLVKGIDDGDVVVAVAAVG